MSFCNFKILLTTHLFSIIIPNRNAAHKPLADPAHEPSPLPHYRPGLRQELSSSSLHFNAYRKKRYEKFQAVSFCESTQGNLDFIGTLSSVYYSWLYEGHSLGQRLAVGPEVRQPLCSAGDPTQVSSVYRGRLRRAGFAPGRPCAARHTARGAERCPSVSPVVCVSWGSAGCFKPYLGAQRMCAQSCFGETKCHLREVPQFFIFWGFVTEQFILGDRGS